MSAQSAEAVSAHADDVAHAKPLRASAHPLNPLREFRRIWKEQTIWNTKEKAVMSVLIVLADNLTRVVHGHSLVEIADKTRLSKSSVLRALHVLADLAGVLTRIKSKTPDGNANEINGYELRPDILATWTGMSRPNDWNPQPKPRKGGGVSMAAAISISCVPEDDAKTSDLQAKEGGGGGVKLTPGGGIKRAPCAATSTGPCHGYVPPVAEPAIEPPAPASIADLAEQKPKDDLLAVLARGVEQGHSWCISVAERVLERGGRITDNERKRLREIRDEANAPTKRAGRVSSVQPMGPYRPTGKAKGAPT